MADSDLTLPATVALELGGTVDQARLTRLISAASAAIARNLNRPRMHYGAAISEKVAGYGRERLVLGVAPVISLTSVTLEDGTVLDPSDYELEDSDAGLLYRGSGWPWTGVLRPGLLPNELVAGSERPSITVVYSGGWVTPAQAGSLTRTLPYDIEEAAVQTVVALYRKAGADPTVASESLGDYSVSYRGTMSPGGIIPEAVLAQLATYRRPPL